MKKIALISLFLIAGCVTRHAPTLEEAQVQSQMSQSKTECYRMQANMAANLFSTLAQLPEEDRALALLMLQQQNASKELVAVATGHSLDPCGGGSNIFDVEIADLNAQTKLAGHYIDLGKFAVGTTAAVIATDSIVDAIAGSAAATGINIAASDNAKVNYQSQNKDAFQTAGNDISTTGTNNITNNNDDCIDCDQDRSTGEAGIEGGECKVDADCVNNGMCVEGQCIPSEVDPSFEQCMSNPPGGWKGNSSTPMWNSECSCHSHFITKSC